MDAIQQNYRAAFFDYVEAEQPIELPFQGKENVSEFKWEPHTVSDTNQDTTKI